MIVPTLAVNGIILDPSGKVLLTLRSKHIREGGRWCLPGGHFEVGETWRNALHRELQEELGIKVTQDKLIGLYSDPKVTVTPNPVDGKYIQFLVASFLILSFEGNPTLSDEVEKIDWFDIQNLPNPIVRSHPIRILDANTFSQNPSVGCFLR